MIKLVCLDTSVLRNIIDKSPDISNEFRAIKDNFNVKFRIAETAFAEILDDLFDGTINFSDWESGVIKFDSFIDKNHPVQEQGYNLAVEMKIFNEKKKKLPLYSSKYWVKIWNHITNAKSLNDLQKHIIFYINRKPYKLKIEGDLIEPALDDSRKDWYKFFEDVKAIATADTTIEEIETEFSNGFSEFYNVEKMVDFTKVLARYAYIAISNPDFNPYSKKRKNDSIDFSFIQLLAKPAIFCTSDLKFQKFVVDSNAPNKENIKTPSEVINYYNIPIT